MNKTLIATAVVSLLNVTSNVHAQSSSDTETMIVTANRFEQPIQNTIAPVEIITKEDIDLIQAKSLTEVLRRMPGIQISSSGGYGQSQSVYVRGSESNHVLVLVNGVRIGSATLGSANFAAIPLTGVERIEYIRGSRAAVYGSDAVGGVINIITQYRKGESAREISLGAGSDQYKTAKLSAAGEINENLWGKFAVNLEESDGYSASNVSGQEDDDGFKSTDIVAELGGFVSSDWRLKANVLHHDGKVEYDNPESSNKKVEVSNYSIGAEYLGSLLYSNLTAAFNTDKSEIMDTGSDSLYQTDRTVLNWQNTYQYSEELSLGGGVDWYRNDIAKSTGTFEKTKQDNLAYYLMGLYSKDSLSAEANVRTDDNQEYGTNNTWQLGLGWKPTSRVKLTGSAGTAFKAPTFNDLYFPVQCFPPYGCFGGNENLKPETSQSIEFGLEGTWEEFDVRIAVFKQDIDNLIVWGNTPENVSEAEIKGVEFTANFASGAFDHNVTLEYLDPKNELTGKQLRRRSKHVAKWNISYYSDNWQGDLGYLYQGKRFEDADNTTELEAYSLVDMAGSYFITDALTLKGRIANLFDEDYVLSEDFNTQERSYYVTASYQF